MEFEEWDEDKLEASEDDEASTEIGTEAIGCSSQLDVVTLLLESCHICHLWKQFIDLTMFEGAFGPCKQKNYIHWIRTKNFPSFQRWHFT